ncbi:hypothetical protein [Bacteroides sp.]|uniref:hypothetical protein n=1 Tax=Bacteroides sp. TaxID=29523 RepID=UPI00260F3B3F|nr:hypothetical protein [Bacteroides sp.]MDD3040522.1 hypothetical protein [Bacteroides sp.]
MTNPFTLFDIKNLVKSFSNATIAHDCLAPFLNSYDFDSVYGTDDNSLVFDAVGANDISIEFFNFENPVARTMSIMYYENRKPVILHY